MVYEEEKVSGLPVGTEGVKFVNSGEILQILRGK